MKGVGAEVASIRTGSLLAAGNKISSVVAEMRSAIRFPEGDMFVFGDGGCFAATYFF